VSLYAYCIHVDMFDTARPPSDHYDRITKPSLLLSRFKRSTSTYRVSRRSRLDSHFCKASR
jgi:hypothetical protein